MGRKRDLPAAAATASAAHDTAPLFLPTSAYDTAWNYDHNSSNNSNTTNKTLHYPSPNNKIDGLVTAGVATVSPFSHRVMTGETSVSPLITSPPLSPVPEEETSNFEFSQSSNTSTLTFDCNNAASDSNCSMEMSGEDSLGAITSGGNVRNGAMIGSVIDRVVGCSVGGRPSFISSGSLLHDIEVGMQSPDNDECQYPPMKRSRLDYGLHVLSQSSNDYAMSSSPPAPIFPKACKTACKISDTKKSKMHTDKYDFCCHVCFLGASNDKNSRFSSMSSVDDSSVPERHSLLAYFQPTKRKTPQHHQPTNSIHSFQSSLPTSLNLHPCRYCDKPTCITCTRQCEQCLNRFCTFCTKVDYEMSITERTLCFECDEHHERGTHGNRFVRRKDDKESICMMDI